MVERTVVFLMIITLKMRLSALEFILTTNNILREVKGSNKLFQLVKIKSHEGN